MCSFQDEGADMDNYQGDLTDILRACTSSGEPLRSGWKVPDAVSGHEPTSFGNPFCYTRDPLLHDLHVSHASPSPPSFFVPPNPIPSKEIITPTATAGTDHNDVVVRPNVFEESRKCSNRFSHMLQISAAVDGGASGLVPGDSVINANSSNSSAGQVSSPRNPGVKRRKRQATKVVCVPAPASVNNRPSTGEVVPSDLWAWRKYGQKPIKGSPYPRGYYRCSSSKGCSARKQVERSRTDPNMLVITYTSEHNHPWPTQRNALAGSTRSHPTKSTTSSAPPPPKLSSTTQQKEEQKETTTINNTLSPSSTVASVKEEIQDTDPIKARFDMDDDDGEVGFSYKPVMPCDEDNFFAELGEIEADPDLHTLFTKGFDQGHDRPKDQTKGLDDQFSLFQW